MVWYEFERRGTEYVLASRLEALWRRVEAMTPLEAYELLRADDVERLQLRALVLEAIGRDWMGTQSDDVVLGGFLHQLLDSGELVVGGIDGVVREQPYYEHLEGPERELEEAPAAEPVRREIFEAQVFWRAGKPLIDTNVALVDPDGRTLARGTTDAQGWVRFPGTFPADCTVECLSLPVSWHRMLHLRFVGADRHTPVANESVTFTEWGEQQSATTDEQGVVRFPELTDTFYNITIKGKKLRVPTVTAGTPAVLVVVEPEAIRPVSQRLADAAAAEETEEHFWHRDHDDEPVVEDYAHLPPEEILHPDEDHEQEEARTDDDDDDDLWHDHLAHPGTAARHA
jgi:hypothetical protein